MPTGKDHICVNRTGYPDLSRDVVDALKPWLSEAEIRTAELAFDGDECEHYQGARYAMYQGIVLRGGALPSHLIEAIEASNWGRTRETLGEAGFLQKIIELSRRAQLVAA